MKAPARPTASLLATAIFLVMQALPCAGAAVMTVTVEGVIKGGYNFGLDPADRPYFDGVDPNSWKGLHIYMSWLIKPQFVPADQCAEPTNWSDQFFGCYSQQFGSPELGGNSSGSTGKSYAELQKILIGSGASAFELVLPALPAFPLYRELEDLSTGNTTEGYNYPYDNYAISNTVTSAAGLPLQFVPGPQTVRSSARGTGLYFQADDFLSSDAFLQAFVADGIWAGNGTISLADVSQDCVWTSATNPPDGPYFNCVVTQADQGVIEFFPTRVTAVVSEPSALALLCVAMPLLLGRRRRQV